MEMRTRTCRQDQNKKNVCRARAHYTQHTIQNLRSNQSVKAKTNVNSVLNGDAIQNVSRKWNKQCNLIFVVMNTLIYFTCLILFILLLYIRLIFAHIRISDPTKLTYSTHSNHYVTCIWTNAVIVTFQSYCSRSKFHFWRLQTYFAFATVLFPSSLP